MGRIGRGTTIGALVGVTAGALPAWILGAEDVAPHAAALGAIGGGLVGAFAGALDLPAWARRVVLAACAPAAVAGTAAIATFVCVTADMMLAGRFKIGTVLPIAVLCALGAVCLAGPGAMVAALVLEALTRPAAATDAAAEEPAAAALERDVEGALVALLAGETHRARVLAARALARHGGLDAAPVLERARADAAEVAGAAKAGLDAIDRRRTARGGLAVAPRTDAGRVSVATVGRGAVTLAPC